MRRAEGFIKQIIKSTILWTMVYGLWTTSLFAQFTLKSSLDTNQYLIGDYIKLKIQATYDSGYDARFPLFEKSIQIDSLLTIEPIDIIEQDSSLNGKIIKKNITYFFSAYDSGNYTFPPVMVFFFNRQNNAVDSLLTEPISFRVETIAADTTQALKPIKEPLDLPFIFAEIKNELIIGGLILLLIAVIVYYLLTRKKKPVVVEQVEVKRPSHEIALEKLQALKAQKLWQKGEEKAYHSALSEIVREYLENRFRIVALEATTDEIVEKMRIFSIPKEQKIVLQEMLELSDLVKFAKVKPLPDEHERSFEIAYRFIQATKYEGES